MKQRLYMVGMCLLVLTVALQVLFHMPTRIPLVFSFPTPPRPEKVDFEKVFQSQTNGTAQVTVITGGGSAIEAEYAYYWFGVVGVTYRRHATGHETWRLGFEEGNPELSSAGWFIVWLTSVLILCLLSGWVLRWMRRSRLHRPAYDKPRNTPSTRKD